MFDWFESSKNGFGCGAGQPAGLIGLNSREVMKHITKITYRRSQMSDLRLSVSSN